MKQFIRHLVRHRFGSAVLILFVGTSITYAGEREEALIQAVLQDKPAQVTHLLEQGAEADALSSDGSTALHLAAHADRLTIARELVRFGADVDRESAFGAKALGLACQNGNVDMVELLLEAGGNANETLANGETLLMTASRTGVVAVVELLLARGADANLRDQGSGQTPLMWAAHEGNIEVMNRHLSAGAELNAQSKGGYTAFLFAVRQGQMEAVDLLLKAGVDVNAPLHPPGKRSSGPSALGIATINAHYELGALLLRAGANPNHMWSGRAPLHVVTWNRKPGQGTNRPAPPGSGSMDSLDFVRALVAYGADADLRMTVKRAGVRTVFNMKGATPFNLAARAADHQLMRLLVELGADPLIPNEENTTPLLAAAGVGVQSPGEDPGTPEEVLEAVKVAIEFGNNVNAVNDRGETVMHGAAYKHAPKVVPYVHEHGADINVWNRKNDLGWTPLRIAVGVHRTMNLRSCPETAEELEKLMVAAGVSTYVEPETNVSGETN